MNRLYEPDEIAIRRIVHRMALIDGIEITPWLVEWLAALVANYDELTAELPAEPELAQEVRTRDRSRAASPAG